MFAADDTIKEFLVESYENLDQLDRDFVALETDPSQPDRIAAIFRTVHTIKGTSGFLGYSRLESLAHAGEHLLVKLRDGALVLTPDIASALLAMVDRVRAILRAVEATGTEDTVDHAALVERLAAMASGASPPPVVAPPPERVSIPVIAPPVAAPPPVVAASPPVVAAPPFVAQTTRLLVEDFQTQALPVTDTSVRVDVALLDKLMNLVGELVLARNQIMQIGSADPKMSGPTQRLDLITTELQAGVMKTRMQPIGNVWNKLPRVVRDVATSLRKQVRIELVGQDTELDRTILEAIKDPLIHIVRNAVDHGIESAEVRATRGKPRTGTLTLRAFHEGGQVNLEISDDGGGIDAAAVKAKAIQAGLITPEVAERMSERELCQLVFLPGFSTAKKVTSVSGRGVGMDVVKTNIEKIGGTVDIQSRAGEGTLMRIKIPLTLAIIPALVVASRDHRFAIPQASLLELVRIDRNSRHRVEYIHGAPVYRLRGSLLPLVSLADALELSTIPATSDGAVNIVVLQADERQFGLIVDEVRDTEEIVVKPLGGELKELLVYAGATIMGDGRVALILDVVGLAQHTGAVSPDRIVADNHVTSAVVAEQKQGMLVLQIAEDRVAIPLAMVARLEQIAGHRVERVGSNYVVQYRNALMPLVDVASVFGASESWGTGRATIPVVVYAGGGESIGFVVDRIVDIIEEALPVEHGGSRHGIAGTTVIGGRVTEVLDIEALVSAHSSPTRSYQ